MRQYTEAFAAAAQFAARRSRTILLVEDEVLVRLHVAGALVDAGFDVIQARNADDALTVLEGPTWLDLVLTDVKMPGSLDGVELARNIRNQWPDLKVIIGSGDVVPPVDVADAFFPKPYNLPALVICADWLTDVQRMTKPN
jgi:two-component system, response regulator PdtaR